MKISSLKGLSIDALLDTRDAIETMLKERTAQLRRQLASLGAGAEKPRAARGGASKLKGKKVAPKYRGPNGETWAGRGAHPIWLRELLAKGRKLEDFSVGRKKAAKKAGKRVPGKRGRKKAALRMSGAAPEGQTGAS